MLGPAGDGGLPAELRYNRISLLADSGRHVPGTPSRVRNVAMWSSSYFVRPPMESSSGVERRRPVASRSSTSSVLMLYSRRSSLRVSASLWRRIVTSLAVAFDLPSRPVLQWEALTPLVEFEQQER